MDQRQLAAVLLAVVGVFFAASAIPALVSYIAILHQADPMIEQPAGPVSQITFAQIGVWSSLLTIFLGAVILLARNVAAARLFPANSDSISAPEVHAVALSVLGCYLAVRGVSSFLPEALVPGGFIGWGYAIQAFLGIGLFFGARGLSHLWQVARTRGLNKGS